MPVDLRLALLVCDEPAPHIKTICGDYEQSKIFTRLLSSSLARTNSGVTQTFLLDTYDVFKDSKDHQMASTMMAFSSPDLVITRALGGSYVPKYGPSDVAVTAIQLNTARQNHLWHRSAGHPTDAQGSRPQLLPNAHMLGSTDLTPNQGMVIFDPASAMIHMLTIQGHPESTPLIMSMIMDARAGIFGEALANDGRTRAVGIPGRHHPDELACDGVGRIGKAMWGVLDEDRNIRR